MGVLISGSMGEAHHLDPTERARLIREARNALDAAGLQDAPIIAGTSAGSTRETHELTRQAAEAGADYAIVIASGYFAGQLSIDALKQFWLEVADRSPIPVIIYNFPASAGGIDLDSDAIEDLALRGPNFCGVKLTCGNVGKLTRLAAVVSVPSFEEKAPRRDRDAPFLVLGGFADFLLPSTFVRGHGAITGLGNVAPSAVVKLFQLSVEALSNPSVLPEAQKLQDLVARGDRAIAVTGIAGTKYLAQRLFGYPAGADAPRRPLIPLTPKQKENLWQHPDVQALIACEKQLAQSHPASNISGPQLNGVPSGKKDQLETAPLYSQPLLVPAGIPAMAVE
jgi:L-threo-3-deoxy-hexylosonate aldolase